VAPESAAFRDKEHSGDACFGTRVQAPDPAGVACLQIVRSVSGGGAREDACFAHTNMGASRAVPDHALLDHDHLHKEADSPLAEREQQAGWA
jgi:hypothetical protein